MLANSKSVYKTETIQKRTICFMLMIMEVPAKISLKGQENKNGSKKN